MWATCACVCVRACVLVFVRARAALNDRIDEEEASERKKHAEGARKTNSKYGGGKRGREGSEAIQKTSENRWRWVGGGFGGIDRDQRQLPSVGCLRADFN